MAFNLLDLQTAVQDDLGDPAFSTSRITRYLNYGQLAIFNTHRFKFCQKTVTGALTLGQYTYNQQTDHQSTISGVVVDPGQASRRFVLDATTHLESAEFFERFPDAATTTSGLPSYWTEFGTQLYFDRPVDKAYIFSQRYYRVPVSLSSGTDVPTVPEAFRELLELYAAYRSEKYRGNHDVAATYKQDFEDGLENMVLRYSGSTTSVKFHTTGTSRGHVNNMPIAPGVVRYY